MTRVDEMYDVIVELSTWTPHWFGAIDGPVEAVSILGPQGERVDLHD